MVFSELSSQETLLVWVLQTFILPSCVGLNKPMKEVFFLVAQLIEFQLKQDVYLQELS